MSKLSTENAKEKDRLLEIYENLIRTDERLKALIKVSELTNSQFEKQLGKIDERICNLDKKIEERVADLEKKVEDRIIAVDKKTKESDEKIDALEKEGVKLSLFWKFLMIFVPVIIALLGEAIRKLLGV